MTPFALGLLLVIIGITLVVGGLAHAVFARVRYRLDLDMLAILIGVCLGVLGSVISGG